MLSKGIRPHRRVPTRRSALHVIPSADTSSLLPPSAPLPCEGALEAHKGRSRACGRRAIFRIVDACPARLEDAEMREVDMECGEHGLGIEWADDVVHHDALSDHGATAVMLWLRLCGFNGLGLEGRPGRGAGCLPIIRNTRLCPRPGRPYALPKRGPHGSAS